MNIKEIRGKTEAQLMKEIAGLREKIRDLHFKIHSKEVKNYHELKKIRKDVARILTVLKEKAI